MAEFSLPAPWGAPESSLHCDHCGRETVHYQRRVTVLVDEESDRRAGRVAWFCVECGHKHVEPATPQGPERPDDITELFDRH
jgi:hypothetical protein